VFLGQFLYQFFGLVARGFHKGVVHEEVHLRGAEVLREEMAQSLERLIVDLDVLESVAGDMYRLIIFIDSVCYFVSCEKVHVYTYEF
jgi:hypothetical protein